MSARRIYVVDDDVSVRESLELLIQSAGWYPETFASASAFLARPRVDVPSCLVLDVSLPDLPVNCAESFSLMSERKSAKYRLPPTHRNGISLSSVR